MASRIDPTQQVDRTELTALVNQARAAFDAMSPVDQAISRTRTRASYVRCEMALGLDDDGMTPEQIAALPKDDATILADEVETLRERLNRYETHISTHSEECHFWGPKHYACLLGKFETCQDALAAEKMRNAGLFLERDALAALLKEAGEALRPFASEADKQDARNPDVNPLHETVGKFTIADVRTVRTTLTRIDAALETKGEKDDEN